MVQNEVTVGYARVYVVAIIMPNEPLEVLDIIRVNRRVTFIISIFIEATNINIFLLQYKTHYSRQR